jgi:hypothetical protein
VRIEHESEKRRSRARRAYNKKRSIVRRHGHSLAQRRFRKPADEFLIDREAEAGRSRITIFPPLITAPPSATGRSLMRS